MQWENVSDEQLINEVRKRGYIIKDAAITMTREELLGAIARGWCSEENKHKTMDQDLALAIFDEVEKHMKQHFRVEL